METDISYKITQTRNQMFDMQKEKQRKKISPLELYSSQSNTNIKTKKLQLIPLSLLFRNKLNKIPINSKTNEINNTDNDKRFKSLEKASKTHNTRNITNSLFTHNALSHKRIQLPKIKCYNGNSDLQSRLITSILNKFDQCDNKFKYQGKHSSNIIKMADMDLRLTKDFFGDEGHKLNYFSTKNGFKRQYSKLYRRIKKIQAM